MQRRKFKIKLSFCSIVVLFVNLVSVPSSSAIYAGTNATGTGHVVKIVSPNGSCSGALISPQIVATAAHCIVRSGVAVRPEDLKIYSPGADTNINSTYSTGYAVFYPSNFLNSTSYTEPNDAAFIVLNQKIENSKPLVLANYNMLQSIISSGNPIYIFGYGATVRNGFSSNIPYSFRAKPTAQVRIFGFQGYERTYTSYINDFDGATCPGDSGGPGISEYKGVSYLVSINSGGVGPCSGDSSQGSWRSNATIAGEYQYLLDKANALLATLKPAEVLSPSILTTSMSGLISWTPPPKSPAAITAFVVKDDAEREICRTSSYSCEVALKVGGNIFKIYSVAGSILSDGVVIEYETQNAVPPVVEEVKTYETYVKVIWGEISEFGNTTQSSVEIIIQDGLSKEILCKAQVQIGECTFTLLPQSYNLELILNSNIAMTRPLTIGRFSGITQLSLINRTKNNLAYLIDRVKSLIVSNPGYTVELNALLTATPKLNENFEFTEGKLQEILDLSNQTSELVKRIASSPRKITITCVRGKLTKKVIAVKPACPSGYIKK